jgi:Arc-like DNA binding domain
MVRKGKELRPVMTRIPETLRRRLEREAELNGRSMNAEMIVRLESSFRRQDAALDMMKYQEALDAFGIKVTEEIRERQEQFMNDVRRELKLPGAQEEAKLEVTGLLTSHLKAHSSSVSPEVAGGQPDKDKDSK